MNYQQELIDNGGFTVNLTNGKQPTTGFVVARDKLSERTISLHQMGYITTTVNHYIEAHDPEWLGAWVDDGLVYLDCVEVFVDRDEAAKAAADRNQIAFYDVENNEVIYVSHSS